MKWCNLKMMYFCQTFDQSFSLFFLFVVKVLGLQTQGTFLYMYVVVLVKQTFKHLVLPESLMCKFKWFKGIDLQGKWFQKKTARVELIYFLFFLSLLTWV